MSFLRLFLMSWLASKAMETLEQKVAQTIHETQKRSADSHSAGNAGSESARKNESSQPGSSSQKSEKNSSSTFQQKSEKRDLEEFKPVEIGMVFAMSQELVGILDQMKSTKITKGNGFKYYSGIWKKRRIVLVECGVGQKRSEEATKALIQVFRPQRLVSAGFAGALVASLKRFQIIVPRFLIRESDGETLNLWGRLLESPQLADQEKTVDSSLFDDSFDATFEKGIKADQTFQDKTVRNKSSEKDCSKSNENSNEKTGKSSKNPYFLTGTLLTTDRVIAKTSEKEALAKKFGATVVDMETWAVAQVCQENGVPFLPVRIVYDSFDQKLPKEIQNITKSSHNKARLIGALFGAVCKRPSSVVDMVQLKQNALVAADKIALAIEKIVLLNE